MITRYYRDIMHDLFTEKSKFQSYLDVEIACLDAYVKLGVIPKEDVLLIKKKVKFDVEKIKEIEKETKHDVIAFTRCLSLSLGDEKKWIHYGLTSTDVVDTANALIYKKANDIIYDDLLKLKEVLTKKALQYKNTFIIGRTHGIHADITTFGLKYLLYLDELNKDIKRFNDAKEAVQTGKISGAVGNYCNLDPKLEEMVCKMLGINKAKISTQVLSRDNHAYFMSVCALIASLLEKIATEIRHLQRTEVNEAMEYFDKFQKGSSAMPHKRNPIGSENICGCARVIKSYMHASFENNALWHERDISHSSVERIIFPDCYMLLDYMINRLTNIVDNLIVNEENMLNNINKTYKVIFAQRVMNVLINKGNSREFSYDLVQKKALDAYNNKINFDEYLQKDKEITKILTKDEINSCFTLDYYLKNVDYIYNSILKE